MSGLCIADWIGAIFLVGVAGDLRFCSGEMMEVPISPGDKSVPVVLLLTALIFMFCVSGGIGSLVKGDWLEGSVDLVVLLSVAVYLLVLWRGGKLGRLRLRWDAPSIRIVGSRATLFEGDISQIEGVDEDLQAFFLLIRKRGMFRLERGDTPQDLVEVLEGRIVKDRGE